MTIQQWRCLCAKIIGNTMSDGEWSQLVQVISRCEVTARKQVRRC